MNALIAGLGLWAVTHLFKRIAPAARARMGDAGKGVIALVLLLSVVLMVWGYRQAPVDVVYAPPAWGKHLNNLLLLVGAYLLGVGHTKGTAARMRHPMLTAVVVWGLGHLLVRGDVASLILFGGLTLWALAEMAIINRAEPGWTPPATSGAGDAKAVAGAIVVLALAWAIHRWLGYNIFGA